jgi:hypothetical protein
MATRPGLDDLLHKQACRQRTFSFPVLVSDRLDDLCAVLNRKGTVGDIRRQLLVAALIACAPEGIDDLQKLIEEYRNKKVADSLVGDAKAAQVIQLRAVKPGRRLSE